MEKVGWEQVLEASLEQLVGWTLDVSVSFDSPLTQVYARALSEYLQGELPAWPVIEERLSRIDCSDDREAAREILLLRHQIRRLEIDKQQVSKVRRMAASKWIGEAPFVAALAYSSLDEHELAGECFIEAYRGFKAQGVNRKALKCLHNQVVIESRIHPQKTLLAEYRFVARKAKEAGDLTLAGLANLNISREFQLVGALDVALESVDLAIEQMQADEGSLPYFMSLVHRAHVHFELGNRQEAEKDRQAAMLASFPEVRAALGVLATLMGKSERFDSCHLTPTWRERQLRLEEELPALGPLEQKLLQLLINGPRSKFDLIDALYGDVLDIDVLENRFKNLMSRLRKKLPGTIELRDGLYRVYETRARRALEEAVQ